MNKQELDFRNQKEQDVVRFVQTELAKLKCRLLEAGFSVQDDESYFSKNGKNISFSVWFLEKHVGFALIDNRINLQYYLEMRHETAADKLKDGHFEDIFDAIFHSITSDLRAKLENGIGI